LEGDIKTALSALAGGRCTPDVTPDIPVFPLFVYQQVGGDAVDFLECKVANKDHARIQLWVWAKTRLEASSLAHSARIALVEGSLKAYTYAAPVSEYNEELKLYGNRTDFGIWYTP
jgi:hypothetical protein